MTSTYSVVAVAIVITATMLIGANGLRLSRTTSDFYVASRTVSPWWNASAIGGEYLSAASFLGVAGLIFAYGADMLWFAVGYTAGYLVLLTLVAAPLRRSGAYTLPDFAEERLASVPVRRIASLLTVGIGWLYLLPQLQGAGLTLYTVTGLSPLVGAVAVAVVVVVNVMAGGMRSITIVQAFQFWLKLAAITIPMVFLLLAWQHDGAPTPIGPTPPAFTERTTVRVNSAVTVRVHEPVRVTVTGVVDGDRLRESPVRLSTGTHRIDQGTSVTFPAGAVVPQVTSIPATTGEQWALPLSGTSGDHSLYVVYSLIVATFLGVMGLPHVIVRFYTNPNGWAARRTTVVLLVLLGVFYVQLPLYGMFGRLYTPELLMTGRTDATILLLPARVIGGLGGDLLSALVAGGAFAAFLSTASGLTVAVAGVISRNTLRRFGITGFRIAAVGAMTVPLAMTLVSSRLSVADVVGLAFAVAASSLCPLVVLGIWWRGLTSVGAAAGMTVGGGLALTAGLLTLMGAAQPGWWMDLLRWPAAWTVPIGFAVMVGVSLATPGSTPPGVARLMARLHAPESLGLRSTAAREEAAQ